MANLQILSFFLSGGTPAIGLSPHLNGWRVLDGSMVISSQVMTEVNGGFYTFQYTDYNASNDYCFLADAASGMASHERWAYSTNEGSISTGGGGGGSRWVQSQKTKSPWTHMMRDEILLWTKETKDNVELLSRRVDDYQTENTNQTIDDKSHLYDKLDENMNMLYQYHTQELFIINQLHDKEMDTVSGLYKEQIKRVNELSKKGNVDLNTKVRELSKTIKYIRDDINKKNKGLSNESTKKLDMSINILEGWKESIKNMSSVQDINDMNTDLEKLIRVVVRSLSHGGLITLSLDETFQDEE